MIGRSSRVRRGCGVGEQPIGPLPVAGPVAIGAAWRPTPAGRGPARPGPRSARRSSTASGEVAVGVVEATDASAAASASGRATGPWAADTWPDELRRRTAPAPEEQGRRLAIAGVVGDLRAHAHRAQPHGVPAVAGEALGGIATELVELVEASELGQGEAEGRTERADPRARPSGPAAGPRPPRRAALRRGGPGTGSRRGRCGHGPRRRPRRRARRTPWRSPRPRRRSPRRSRAVAVMKPANMRRNGCPVRSASAAMSSVAA